MTDVSSGKAPASFDASWNLKVLGIVVLVLTVPMGVVFSVAPGATGIGRVIGLALVFLGSILCFKFWKSRVWVDETSVTTRFLRTRLIPLSDIVSVALGSGGFVGWQTPVLVLSNGKRVRLEQVADPPRWLSRREGGRAAELVARITSILPANRRQ